MMNSISHYFDMHLGVLRQLLEFARENDSLVSKIATRGRAFVWDHLKTSENVRYLMLLEVSVEPIRQVFDI